MIEPLRYFIVPILHTTSAGDSNKFNCRVINQQYREIFNDLLDEEDKEIFERIMNSDKDALLYLRHPVLGKMAELKIDEQQKISIIDGTKCP